MMSQRLLKRRHCEKPKATKQSSGDSDVVNQPKWIASASPCNDDL